MPQLKRRNGRSLVSTIPVLIPSKFAGLLFVPFPIDFHSFGMPDRATMTKLTARPNLDQSRGRSSRIAAVTLLSSGLDIRSPSKNDSFGFQFG